MGERGFVEQNKTTAKKVNVFSSILRIPQCSFSCILYVYVQYISHSTVLPRLAIPSFTRLFRGEGKFEYTFCDSICRTQSSKARASTLLGILTKLAGEEHVLYCN